MARVDVEHPTAGKEPLPAFEAAMSAATRSITGASFLANSGSSAASTPAA